MTYNHDASKQAQIEVMEVGAGNLTPEMYYKVTHHNYWEGAKATTSVKNFFMGSPFWLRWLSRFGIMA